MAIRKKYLVDRNYQLRLILQIVILVVVLVTWLLGSSVFDIEPGVLPSWIAP